MKRKPNHQVIHEIRKKSPSNWPVYALVGTVACAVYLNGIDGDFVHDDIPAVTSNKDVLALSPVGKVFENDFWGTPMAEEDSHKSYRPLTVLTFRANYLAFGLTPLWFHLTNVVLHALVCILFTRVCLCVASLKPQFATLAGILFGVHPIHTEAVTGIVGRADVLACVFFLLSLLAYHGHPDGKCRIWTSIIMGGMSMLAKETGVTVFLINLAFDLYLQWTNIKRTIFEVRWNTDTLHFAGRAVKILTSTGIFLALRLAILQGSLPKFSEQDNPTAFNPSLCVRFLTFCYLAAFNWWLLLCPSTLSHDWQMGSIPLVTSLGDSRNLVTVFFFGLLFLLALKGVCDFENSRHPPLILGILLLVLPFLPASNLLLTVGFVVAERVLYIPSLGYIILVVYGIQIFWKNCVKHRQSIVCCITLLLVTFSLRTVVRNKDWKSRESLLRAGLATLPQNAKMHYNYANFLRDSSLHQLAKSHYYTALKLWPSYASAHNNLGTILESQREAELHFLEAIKYSSNHVNAHYNLGQLYRKINRSVESEHMLKKCIKLEPTFAPAYLELAKLRGPNDKSIFKLLNKVVKLNPTNAHYGTKFANWLTKKSHFKEALNYYVLSLRISAKYQEAIQGVFKLLRKFGQKSRLFQVTARWHILLRKNSIIDCVLKNDIYLQEWELKKELNFKIKSYTYECNNISSKNSEPTSGDKSKIRISTKHKINKTASERKFKIEEESFLEKGSRIQAKSLDFSKFTIISRC